ncbi:MAG: outer membrane lipoprotein chaperone LolA [Pontibacterium sp.]
MNLFKKLSVILVLLMFWGNAQAQLADEKLKSLLDNYQRFSADFSQIVSADQGRRTQESKGRLVVEKPNRFRWENNEPFPQEIIGDGRYIWVYDPDLEQVTRKPAQNGTGSAPALILNGQIDELRERFRIFLLSAEGESDQLFELVPKSDQNTFSRIRLFFSAEMISELMLEDSLGQRTTVVFSNQRLNPKIDASEFEFVLPEGVDLIMDTDI